MSLSSNKSRLINPFADTIGLPSIFFAIIAIGIISISYFYDEVDLKRNTTDDTIVSDKKFLRISPELKEVSGYINTSSEEIKQMINNRNNYNSTTNTKEAR